MNKNLLSLAVATALATPALVAPSTASAEAILYGKINVSVDYINVDANATYFRPGNTVGPQLNANTFFYGANQSTAANATTVAWQDANLRAQLGQVPIFNGVYVPGAYAAGTGNPATNGFNPILTPGPQQGSLVSGPAGFLAAARDLAYNAAYNNQVASFGPNPTAIQLANAETNALAVANTYPTPDQIAAAQTGMIPLTAAQQANLTAAQNAAAEAAALNAGVNGGAIAFNNYYTTQTTAIAAALRNGTLNAQEAAQAFNMLQTAIGPNGLGGMKATGLRAQALNSVRVGQKYNGWGLDTSNAINGPASRVGVKGSEDLGNGLKAIYQIELGVDISNANRDYNLANGNRGNTPGAFGGVSSSGFSFRNTFVGLASEWGTLLLGRHDTPLKISTARLDLFADTLADYNSTIGFQDIRADNAVAYITPNWSGFQLMAAAVPQNASVPVLLNGFPDNQATSFAGSYSIAGTYKNGPFYGSVAYEALGKSNFSYDNIYYTLLFNNRTAKVDSKVRVGLGLLDWNGFSLTGIYEQRNNIAGAPMRANGNYFQVQAAYAFGNNMLKAMWGRADLEACADPNNVGFRYTCQAGAMGQYFAGSNAPLVDNKQKSAWAVGYDYNFSKRTQAFLLYTAMDDKVKKSNWDGFSLGMMHSF